MLFYNTATFVAILNILNDCAKSHTSDVITYYDLGRSYKETVT